MVAAAGVALLVAAPIVAVADPADTTTYLLGAMSARGIGYQEILAQPGANILTSTFAQPEDPFARAASTGHGVSIGGGVVRIGRYESVAEASSDGVTGAGHAGTVVEGATVNGINAVLDPSGLHAAGADLTPAERAALDNQITAAL